MPAAKKKPVVAAPARPAPARKRAVPTAAATPHPAPLPVTVRAEPAGKPAPAKAATAKADKARKVKILRDSFTMPKTEYAVLEALKDRATKAGRPAKKSEVLRAGVKALAAMGDVAFLAALGAVPAVKTGRPAKS